MNITDLLLMRGIFPGPNVRVTHAAQNEPRSESSISVDPSRPNRLLGASKRFYDPHKYLFNLSVVFSDDAGATWQDLPPLARPANHEVFTDPSTVFDTLGNAWVMGDPGFETASHPDLFQSLQCSSHGQAQTDDIMTTQMLANKSANGLTWNHPVPIVGVRCWGDDKGWIVCDNTHVIEPPHTRVRRPSPFHGRLYAIWGAVTPLRFARSSDGGQTWSGVGNSAAGSDVAAFTYAPDISISRNGIIHVFWHLRRSGTIEYLRSTDGGETFQGSGSSNGMPQSRSVVTGLTDIDSGIGSNSQDWPTFPGSNFRVITIVSSCCFGDHGVAVAWADARPDRNGQNHSRIYYRISHDDGLTWDGAESGIPMLPFFGGDHHQFNPQLAVTQTGVLGCAMYSYGRNAAAFGTKPGIAVLIAASFDDGATWSFDQVTDQPWDPSINAPWAHGDSNITFIGEYFGFDAGRDDFHILWTDTRFNNQDLFYCRVDTEKSRRLDDFGKLVATYLSPGVENDGGGFVIVGGHIVKVGPGDPMREVLDLAVALETVSRIGRADTAKAKAALYDLVIAVMQQAKNEIR